MKTRKLAKIFNLKIRVNKKERVLLTNAIKNNGGDIREPANNDIKTMEVIINLYDKRLINIDFETDKLKINRFGRFAIQ